MVTLIRSPWLHCCFGPHEDINTSSARSLRPGRFCIGSYLKPVETATTVIGLKLKTGELSGSTISCFSASQILNDTSKPQFFFSETFVRKHPKNKLSLWGVVWITTTSSALFQRRLPISALPNLVIMYLKIRHHRSKIMQDSAIE